MRKFLLVLLTLATLGFAAPAAADPPTDETFEGTFDDVNPCTGRSRRRSRREDDHD